MRIGQRVRTKADAEPQDPYKGVIVAPEAADPACPEPDPTASLAMVLVAWSDDYRNWEYVEDLEAARTFVIVGQNRWGQGTSLGEAKKEFRRQGATLSGGYTIFTFDADTSFEGVDVFGRVHYILGNPPEVKDVEPKKVTRR